MAIQQRIGTENYWQRRKHYCLSQVYTNLDQLIADSKDPKNVSLAKFKPAEVGRLEIEETDREWKKDWQEQLKQFQIPFGDEQVQQSKVPVEKLPVNSSIDLKMTKRKKAVS